MRFIKYTSKVLLACYMAILLALAVPSVIGMQVYTVISPSMSPGIPTGAAVYVKYRPFSEIQKGDVITYRTGEDQMAVTHRVVEKLEQEQAFRTKGDANRSADSKNVKWEYVLGTVAFSVPWLGYAALFLEDVKMKVAVAGLFFWILAMQMIAEDVIKMKREADSL